MKPRYPRQNPLRFLPLILVVLIGAAGAQGDKTEPPSYMGRQIAATMHWQGGAWLLRHKRDREEAATRMREFLNLPFGAVVCDFGAGNGYHTFPMAKSVGKEGKVVAIDIQEPFVEAIRLQAAANGQTQVEARLVEPEDPQLEPQMFDVILMVDVYHELQNPAGILQLLRKALKPEGELVLVEYRAEDPEVPIRPEHKMSRPQILKELAANGFEMSKERTELPWQHMIWFRPQASDGESDALPLRDSAIDQ